MLPNSNAFLAITAYYHSRKRRQRYTFFLTPTSVIDRIRYTYMGINYVKTVFPHGVGTRSLSSLIGIRGFFFPTHSPPTPKGDFPPAKKSPAEG